MTASFRRCALGASLILISGCGARKVNPDDRRNRVGEHARKHTAAREGAGVALLLGGYRLVTNTYFFTYPQGKLVGSFNGGGSLCPDNAGNVWVAGYPERLRKRDRGVCTRRNFRRSATPGCFTTGLTTARSIPTTGNLAVTVGSIDSVDVFTGGSSPQTFDREEYLSVWLTPTTAVGTCLSLRVVERPWSGRTF